MIRASLNDTLQISLLNWFRECFYSGQDQDVQEQAYRYQVHVSLQNSVSY